MNMGKAATVQARIEPELKKRADLILKKVGITASQAINALYAQIVMNKGLPFEVKIPNSVTQAAINELEMGKGKRFKSMDEIWDSLDDA